MIGLVLVWKLKDTYKALFEVDTQTMAAAPNTVGADAKGLMNALEKFVRVQSDAALRQVAGQYAYDDEDGKSGEPTLRSSADEINEQLEQKLDDDKKAAMVSNLFVVLCGDDNAQPVGEHRNAEPLINV